MKKNVGIQNDMTWDQNFSANHTNIEFTIEKYSSQHKFVCTSPRYGRDEQTSCRPRMRTIGLQKNTASRNSKNDNSKYDEINSKYGHIKNALMNPNVLCCFDYGNGDCQAMANLYRSQSDKNTGFRKTCKHYNMNSNYNGVACNHKSYMENGCTPCSEYNYCCDEYYYDYSNKYQQPVCGCNTSSLSNKSPCCCCAESRRLRKPYSRRASDLGTNDFYCGGKYEQYPAKKERSKSPTHKSSKKYAIEITKLQKNMQKDHRTKEQKHETKADRRRSSETYNNLKSKLEQKDNVAKMHEKHYSDSDSATSLGRYKVKSTEKLIKIVLKKENLGDQIPRRLSDDIDECNIDECPEEYGYSKETLKMLKAMHIKEYKPSKLKEPDNDDVTKDKTTKKKKKEKSKRSSDETEEIKYKQEFNDSMNKENVKRLSDANNFTIKSEDEIERGKKSGQPPNKSKDIDEHDDKIADEDRKIKKRSIADDDYYEYAKARAAAKPLKQEVMSADQLLNDVHDNETTWKMNAAENENQSDIQRSRIKEQFDYFDSNIPLENYRRQKHDPTLPPIIDSNAYSRKNYPENGQKNIPHVSKSPRSEAAAHSRQSFTENGHKNISHSPISDSATYTRHSLTKDDQRNIQYSARPSITDSPDHARQSFTEGEQKNIEYASQPPIHGQHNFIDDGQRNIQPLLQSPMYRQDAPLQDGQRHIQHSPQSPMSTSPMQSQQGFPEDAQRNIQRSSQSPIPTSPTYRQQGIPEGEQRHIQQSPQSPMAMSPTYRQQSFPEGGQRNIQRSSQSPMPMSPTYRQQSFPEGGQRNIQRSSQSPMPISPTHRQQSFPEDGQRNVQHSPSTMPPMHRQQYFPEDGQRYTQRLSQSPPVPMSHMYRQQGFPEDGQRNIQHSLQYPLYRQQRSLADRQRAQSPLQQKCMPPVVSPQRLTKEIQFRQQRKESIITNMPQAQYIPEPRLRCSQYVHETREVCCNTTEDSVQSQEKNNTIVESKTVRKNCVATTKSTGNIKRNSQTITWCCENNSRNIKRKSQSMNTLSIPEFTGCPCMLNTYLLMLHDCNNDV